MFTVLAKHIRDSIPYKAAEEFFDTYEEALDLVNKSKQEDAEVGCAGDWEYKIIEW